MASKIFQTGFPVTIAGADDNGNPIGNTNLFRKVLGDERYCKMRAEFDRQADAASPQRPHFESSKAILECHQWFYTSPFEPHYTNDLSKGAVLGGSTAIYGVHGESFFAKEQIDTKPSWFYFVGFPETPEQRSVTDCIRIGNEGRTEIGPLGVERNRSWASFIPQSGCYDFSVLESTGSPGVNAATQNYGGFNGTVNVNDLAIFIDYGAGATIYKLYDSFRYNEAVYYPVNMRGMVELNFYLCFPEAREYDISVQLFCANIHYAITDPSLNETGFQYEGDDEHVEPSTENL